MRVKLEMEVNDSHQIKSKLIQWANQFEEVVWLDSNDYPNSHNNYQAILAVEAERFFRTDSIKALDELKEYRKTNKDWLFGYLSYDAANLEVIQTNQKSDLLQFSKLNFFHPRKIFILKKNRIEIHYSSEKQGEIEKDWNSINEIIPKKPSHKKLNLDVKARLSKQEYLDKVETIKSYIDQGKITEINFCQEFYTQADLEHPLAVYQHLNKISKTPFAAYLRLNDKYVMCASPERYLSHTDGEVKAQPIKGTAKRKKKELEDQQFRIALENNEKEVLENTIATEMIVNELYAIAEEGSVQVTELSKAYTFEQVHQLISTIVCQLHPKLEAIDAIIATYPMGSMTGIPKESSLSIIDELENFNRSLYSGSIGYFAPNDDFDFNVVIRSILYNATTNYVSFAAGGAITALSDPEKEYEECMVKVKAMAEVLGNIVDN